MERKPTREELIAKVTGRGRPPGAVPAPPRPTLAATAVPTRTSPILTAAEQAELAAVGIGPGQPVPQNMADIFAEVRAMAEELPATTDPQAPSTESFIQALVGQKAQAALRDEEAELQALQEEARQASLPENIRAASKFAHEVAALPVVDDRAPPSAPVPPPAATPTAQNQAAPAAAAPLANPPAAAPPTLCPHCQRDLAAPVGPIPSRSDQVAFYHTFLGDVPFTKTYDLFNGHIQVTYRTPTLAESDAIHLQALAEIKEGKLTTNMDYWERTQRLRFALMLQRYKTPTADYVFPASLDSTTNPYSKEFWNVRLGLPDTKTPHKLLDTIENTVVNTCLRRESIYSVVREQYKTFNRLVGKLEELVTDPNFSYPTEPPS